MLCLLLLQFVVFGSAAPGTATPFEWQDLLTPVNEERRFWGLPILDYDDDIAAIAQQTCEACDYYTPSDLEEKARFLSILKGYIYFPGVRYQSFGENRAGLAGVGADPSPELWLNREDWTCADNSCKAGADCTNYTQAIWIESSYMGCGKCQCTTGSPEPALGSTWTYLVCNFVEAGNVPTVHPFIKHSVQGCAHTYIPEPPTQPKPCGERTCADNTCPSPLTGAVCDTTSGAWTFSGNTALADFPKIYLGCELVINGNLIGTENDKLRMTECGMITVTGTTTFSGDPTIDVDYESVANVPYPRYDPFMAGSSPVVGGLWNTPVAQNVWNPEILLCARSITGSNTSYVYIYDCAITPTISSPLPDGGTQVSLSLPSEVVRSPSPGEIADINDPDLHVNPRGTLPNIGNSTTDEIIADWALALICIAVLVFIFSLTVIIFVVFAATQPTERV